MKVEKITWWLTLFLIGLYYGSFAQAPIKPDQILGNYQNSNGSKTICITKKDSVYVAQIVYSNDPSEKGSLLIKDIRFKQGIWKGLFYSKKLGDSFYVELRLPGNDNLELIAKNRTKVWNRIK